MNIEEAKARMNIEEAKARVLGYPIRLTKAEARLLQKLLTMHVDYPELDPEHQELYDKLDAVL